MTMAETTDISLPSIGRVLSKAMGLEPRPSKRTPAEVEAELDQTKAELAAIKTQLRTVSSALDGLGVALPDDEDDDFEELRRGTLFPGAPHSIAKQPDPVATQSVLGPYVPFVSSFFVSYNFTVIGWCYLWMHSMYGNYPAANQMANSAAFIGTFIGMLVFGCLGDVIGRDPSMARAANPRPRPAQNGRGGLHPPTHHTLAGAHASRDGDRGALLRHPARVAPPVVHHPGPHDRHGRLPRGRRGGRSGAAGPRAGGGRHAGAAADRPRLWPRLSLVCGPIRELRDAAPPRRGTCSSPAAS